MTEKIHTEVLIIGAGAAGLMTAIQAASRKRKVVVLESSSKLCEKIRISGGGRCNFTNLNASSENYISQNPHFPKTALNSYTQHDFIKLVEKYRIKFHEKKLGQIFCDDSSQKIIDMLLHEAAYNNVKIISQAKTKIVQRLENQKFMIKVEVQDRGKLEIECESLIMATGGLSIPKIGASDFGYRIAKQFNLDIIEPKAALVPLMSLLAQRNFYKELSGASIDSLVTAKTTILNTRKPSSISFRENILFTHRGLSGPAILQISSYINDGDSISINLIPEYQDFLSDIKKHSKDKNYAKKNLNNILKSLLNKVSNNFIDSLAESYSCKLAKPLGEYPHSFFEELYFKLSDWKFTSLSSEGFDKAEVTRGGINTNELSNKSMATTKIPNLFFVGELVDVTGWLGGYNFQWAWSSGFLAGQHC
ncbi:MAG: aminoacetone oxidase family FAD-binding enzyme [Candidatus Melainabacteria bacterium]|nr:aminoacetone oxidase family FAD-binding enzyme [Candidatus Melainabacteria bacterium]